MTWERSTPITQTRAAASWRRALTAAASVAKGQIQHEKNRACSGHRREWHGRAGADRAPAPRGLPDYRGPLLRGARPARPGRRPPVLCRQRCDCVFHLAGHIGCIGASVTYPVEFLYENLMIAMHVIHAARIAKAGKLFSSGSSCVYPRECRQPMSEDDILTGAFEPTNEGYAIAKIAGMKLCEYSNRQYGTNFLNLMPCNLYGRLTISSRRLARRLGADLQIPRGQAEAPAVGRGLGHRHDPARAFVRHRPRRRHDSLHAERRGEGHRHFREYRARTGHCDPRPRCPIKDIVGYRGEVIFDASKPDGMPRKLMDVSRAARLGWMAKIGIPEGLRLTYDWYVENIAVEEGVE